MAAPNNKYIKAVWQKGSVGEPIRALLAKPLKEYVNMENFKKLFHLDHVESTKANNAGTYDYGLIGYVKEGSKNSLYHNITAQENSHSRLSRLRAKKSDGVYLGLNDAGLNTKADIEVSGSDLKYANYFNFNIKIKSSYYNFTNHAKVEVCRVDANEKVLEPFKVVYNHEETVAPQGIGKRSGQSSFPLGKDGDYLTFRSTVTNEEGDYISEQTKVIKLWESIYFPEGESGKPSVTVRYVPNFTSGNSKNKELYISSKDYDLLKNWTFANPPGVTIVGYNNVMMSHGSPIDYFPIGYFCFEKQKTGESSKWFHIPGTGGISDGVVSNIVIKLPQDDPDYTPSVFKTVSISVQVYPAQYAPQGYPYAIYMQINKNFDDPDVVVKGTFMSASSASDKKSSDGINFYDEVNVEYYENQIPFSVRLPNSKAETSVTEIFCTKIQAGYALTKGLILFAPTLAIAPSNTQLEYENKLYPVDRE